MCGTSGAGKSTWVQEQIAANGGVWCSRDQVRFSLLEDGEDYFAKEDLVVSTWINNIQAALDDENGPDDIYIDATHLNKKSRDKTLKALNLENTQVIAVNFIVPLDICLYRNDFRKGRAFVPRSVIRRMFYTFEPATEAEKFTEIINITE